MIELKMHVEDSDADAEAETKTVTEVKPGRLRGAPRVTEGQQSVRVKLAAAGERR